MRHFLLLIIAVLCSVVATAAPTKPSAEVVSITLRSNEYKPGSRASAVVRFRNTGTPCNKITVRLECEGSSNEFSYNSYFGTDVTKELSTGFNVPDHSMAEAVVTGTVVAIDDQPYEDNKPCTATFTVRDAYPRTVVIEEGTGTWCGWCVRGIVAMEEMHKKYPDTFIGIAVHINDKMSVADYANNLGFEFAPGCNVDRTPTLSALDNVSPLYFESYYTSETQRGAIADFTFDAHIEDGRIVGQSQATFDFDRADADMRMVYVIVEDGVTGYPQLNNYYSGEYGTMGGYENKPRYVEDQVFNDVARAIYPSYRGEPGSLADDVVKGVEYTHEFAYNMPEKVADERNLSIVAMMIDGTTGEIINAHKMALERRGDEGDKDERVKMSKCNGDASNTGNGAGRAIGVSAATLFYADEVLPYVGGKITGMRWYLSSTTGMTEHKVWVKHAIKDTEYLAVANVAEPVVGWNEVTFDQPVELTSGETIVLGYSYNGTGSCYPLTFSNVYSDGGLYMDLGQGMTNYSGIQTHGNLSIEAYVSGVSVDKKQVTLSSVELDAEMYETNATGKAKVRYMNVGPELSSVTINLTCGDRDTDITIDNKLGYGEIYTANIDFTTPSTPIVGAELTARIIAIDGVPCESNTVTAPLDVYSKLYDRTVVIEEGTGTWCGWCVRGIVAMEQMKEKYPDSFVGIAAHNDDPMEVIGYTSNLGIESFPGCTVDRRPSMTMVGVSPDAFETYYTVERARRTYADFTMDAYINETGKVQCDVSAIFDFDREDADVRITTVLLENGVTGYPQANYYAGGSQGRMGGYEGKPSAVYDQVFNDVARKVFPSFEGKKGSLAETIVKGEEYTFNITIAMPKTLQSQDDLVLVALMLDGATGEIINAHKMKLEKRGENGIIDAVAEDDARWYSINGTAVSGNPTRPGLYIKGGRKILLK